MNRRERERVFAASVVVIAVALLAVLMVGGSEHAPAPAASSTTAHVAANRTDGPPSMATGAGNVDDAATAAEQTSTARDGAERIARRFIAAFARYQGGRLDDTTVRRLRALATPELAAYLLAQPPRPTQPSHARMRIERLDVAGPQDGRMKAAALLAYGNERRSLFEIALESSDDHWRVTELYPSGD